MSDLSLTLAGLRDDQLIASLADGKRPSAQDCMRTLLAKHLVARPAESPGETEAMADVLSALRQIFSLEETGAISERESMRRSVDAMGNFELRIRELRAGMKSQKARHRRY